MSKRRVLVVGGTGYLGQHLLRSFAGENPQTLALALTHHSHPPPPALLKSIPQALPFRVDLRTGDGLEAVSASFGQPDVVINCAAISVPRECERHPEAAMSANVPISLVKWLSGFRGSNTLLIHLSTDQVYEGTKSFYKEEDEAVPVNVYGKSKLEAERYISANCSNYAILRSSIIYGPQTVSPVPKQLPVQWMDSALAKGEPLGFFHDEFRCPVFVEDLVLVIQLLSAKWLSSKRASLVFSFLSIAMSSQLHSFTASEQIQLLINVGGPERLSRIQMAEAVAEARGYCASLIKPQPAASVDRGVKSPSDISMDISKLIQLTGISPTCYAQGVRLTLQVQEAAADS